MQLWLYLFHADDEKDVVVDVITLNYFRAENESM